VPGAPGADVLVGRVCPLTSGVARDDLAHPLEYPVRGIKTPKTATSYHIGFHALKTTPRA